MKPFEYARPTSETQALELLNDHDADTAVLAGGTDLVSLLKQDLLTPERVVDIKHVDSMQGVTTDGDGVRIGALTTLEEVIDSPLMAEYRSVLDVIDGIRSVQLHDTGTIGGDVCHLPNCWYFRNGYGLLGLKEGKSLVAAGENRYHAILGNTGLAKFVSASRFAPGLIAFCAKVRIIGPDADQETTIPLESFYQTPRTPQQSVTVLKPGQLISHLILPAPGTQKSATYEVLQMQGLDWPLASCAVTLDMTGSRINQARVVLGHVAPTPWLSLEAALTVQGKTLTEQLADEAGQAAVASATPLSGNEYKVQIAKTAVKRALLRAAEMLDPAIV